MNKKFLFSAGQVIAKLAMFSFYILLPRFIGLEEYGRFTYTLAFCFMGALPIVELGLDMIVTKWVSRGAEDVIKKAFFIRFFSSITAIVLILGVSPIFKTDLSLTLVLTLYLIFMAFSNLIFSFFRGQEKFIYEAFLFPGSKVLALIILLILSIFFHLKSAFVGGWALLCSAILILGIGLTIFKSHYCPQYCPQSATVSPSYSELLKEAFTLFLTSILWMLYFRVDTLMLGLMVNTKEVGWYNAAYRLMEGSFVVPAIIMAMTYPRLSKQKNFLSIFFKTLLIMICLGILCMIAIYLCASPVILTLYGEEFKKSDELLKLLSVAVIPVFIGHLTTQSLVALDKSKLYLLFTLIATFLNIGLNWVFIPRWQAFGAAYATVITETFVVAITGGWIWANMKKINLK